MFARQCDNRTRRPRRLLRCWPRHSWRLFSDPPGDWKYLQLVVVIILHLGILARHWRGWRPRDGGPPSPYRREGRSSPLPTNTRPLEPRTFRYGSTPWRRGHGSSAMRHARDWAVCSGEHLGCGRLGDPVGAALVCGGTWPSGLVLCDYARRYLRVCIRVDAEGLIHSSTTAAYACVGTRSLRQSSNCVAPMVVGGGGFHRGRRLRAGRIFLVYSDRAKLWFSNSLVDAETLALNRHPANGSPLGGDDRPQGSMSHLSGISDGWPRPMRLGAVAPPAVSGSVSYEMPPARNSVVLPQPPAGRGFPEQEQSSVLPMRKRLDLWRTAMRPFCCLLSVLLTAGMTPKPIRRAPP